MKKLDIHGALSEVIANSACEVAQGDWLGEDGFIHCKMCGEAKEMQITVLETKTVKVRRECACMRAEREKREAEAARKEATVRAERRKRDCFYDPMMFEWTFSNDDQKDAKTSKACRRFVENFEQFKSEGKGLLFYGAVGTGKTYFAACIANELIEKGYRVKFTNFARMGNHLNNSFQGRQELIDGLRFYDLVVLDDLGAERKTDTMNEHVYQIVNTLYQSGTPAIYTTNLSKQELNNPANASFQRVYDRILERCLPVEVNGENRRIGKAIDDYGRMREILGL